ncbi:MAG: hypothetical protein HUU47_10460 [Bacteroidetes bacterium]|nr:hypothetical protein [Bacteroidota bacterium]
MYNTTQSNIYESLSELMKMYPEQLSEQIQLDIENFGSFCSHQAESDSQKLLASIFVNALQKRIFAETGKEHIYLQKDEIPQIRLFDVLIKKFPFVKYSQEIINNAIIKHIKQCDVVTIVDIGIGLGTQMMNIIELSKDLPMLKKMNIIGIEPFADGLDKAEANILALNKKVPFEISFTAINEFVENVDFSAIKGISGKLIVNASLALHHIQSLEKRQEIIDSISEMSPAAFFLTEPNVNNYELDYQLRFKNCYNHFYSIFQVIDKIEDINTEDKNALKRFFGREINDIMGNEDQDRYERHEPAQFWINRLKESNFILRSDLIELPIETPEGVKINFHEDGFLGFTFENETVLSVIYAC